MQFGAVEDDRLFRDRHAGFGRMVGVIEADGDEIADLADARPNARAGGRQRQAADSGIADRREPAWRECLAGNVRDDAGEIADFAVGVDDAGLFTTGGAKADEFHEGLLRRSSGSEVDHGKAGRDHASDARPGQQALCGRSHVLADPMVWSSSPGYEAKGNRRKSSLGCDVC